MRQARCCVASMTVQFHEHPAVGCEGLESTSPCVTLPALRRASSALGPGAAATQIDDGRMAAWFPIVSVVDLPAIGRAEVRDRLPGSGRENSGTVGLRPACEPKENSRPDRYRREGGSRGKFRGSVCIQADLRQNYRSIHSPIAARSGPALDSRPQLAVESVLERDPVEPQPQASVRIAQLRQERAEG